MPADPVFKAEPVATPPLSSGYLGLNAGYEWSDSLHLGTDNRVGIFGGEGRWNTWLSPQSILQLDIEGETSTAYDCCAGYPDRRSSVAGAAHWAMRDPNAYAAGVFGGASWNRNLLDITGQEDMYHWFAGAEGQLYRDNLTLYGQAGWSDWMSGSEDEGAADNVWFVRGVARYFLTPNDMISGAVGFASGSNTVDGDRLNFLTWGARDERALSSGPFSVYVEYSGMRGWNGPDEYWANEHRAIVGGKLYFAQGTLLSNDRTGASLDLPKLPRAFAWSHDLY